nr:hypothetical protein [uncultured Carboxylicivirga sp.]
MGKLYFKIFVFLTLFWLLDKAFYLVANRSAESEIDKRLEMILNGNMNKDVIVAGSSRGGRDVIASIIQDSLTLSAYNICYPGSDVSFHSFLFEALFKFNKVPKYTILVVDDNQELIPERTVMFRKDRLYPLIKYPFVWKKLAEIDNKEKVFSQLLLLNRLNKSNFDLRTKKFTPHDSLLSCGSMPISWYNKDWNYPFINDDSYAFDQESEELVNTFKTMIQQIKGSGTKLIIVFPPNYKPHSPAFEKRIKSLCGKEVDYYVYNQNDSLYLREDSFFDESHLMRHSAEVFTREIIAFMKQNYKID